MSPREVCEYIRVRQIHEQHSISDVVKVRDKLLFSLYPNKTRHMQSRVFKTIRYVDGVLFQGQLWNRIIILIKPINIEYT